MGDFQKSIDPNFSVSFPATACSPTWYVERKEKEKGKEKEKEKEKENNNNNKKRSKNNKSPKLCLGDLITFFSSIYQDE
jgi:hypothetical protein